MTDSSHPRCTRRYGIYAAGGIVWRPAPEPVGFEILVVHRPKYDDWSFPKGKLESDEMLPAAAVREIAEETGYQVCLGSRLAVTNYPVDGIDKQVTYWLAVPRDTPALRARPHVHPASKKEIDEVRWVGIDQAAQLLTQEFDRGLARRAGQLLAAGWGCSAPVVLFRHAKAKAREDWAGDDALRPLRKKGCRQARDMVPVLAAFGVSRVVTSPWKRAALSVEPYLEATGIAAEYTAALSEAGFASHPETAQALLSACVSQGLMSSGVVICSHRPVLESLVAQIQQTAGESFRGKREANWSPLGLAEIMVSHFGYSQAGEAKLLGMERYLPLAPLEQELSG